MRSYFLNYLDRCAALQIFAHVAHLRLLRCIRCAHLPACKAYLCLSHPPCSRGPGLEPFVATSLIQLLCRMTKLGWFEDDAYRGLADEARNFLEKGTAVSCPCCFPFSNQLWFGDDAHWRVPRGGQRSTHLPG